MILAFNNEIIGMTEHARLLQSLFIELSDQGFDGDPKVYVESADENLRDLHRLTGRRPISRFQLALCAEAGYWLYRIKELAEKVMISSASDSNSLV